LRATPLLTNALCVSLRGDLEPLSDSNKFGAVHPIASLASNLVRSITAIHPFSTPPGVYIKSHSREGQSLVDPSPAATSAASGGSVVTRYHASPWDCREVWSNQHSPL